MDLVIYEGNRMVHLAKLTHDISGTSKIMNTYHLKSGPSLKSCAALVARDIIGEKGQYLISRIFEIT